MFNRKKIEKLNLEITERGYQIDRYRDSLKGAKNEIKDLEKQLFQLMEKFKYQEGALVSQREVINILKEQLNLEVNRTNSLQLNLLQQNAAQIEKTKEVLSDLFEETEESEEEVISEH